jgi:hypothetical protein
VVADRVDAQEVRAQLATPYDNGIAVGEFVIFSNESPLHLPMMTSG